MNTNEILSKLYPNLTANRPRLVRRRVSRSEPGLVQENGSLASQAHQLASPSTPWPAAVNILSSPDIMAGLLRERLPESVSNGLVLERCHPKILKKRLGSRQVIAYELDFLNNGIWRARRSLRVVAKRYANGAEGERTFHIMQTLWQAGFGEGARLMIPRPLCYLADFRLLIQERARGSLLPAYLCSGDPATRDRMEMVACWLSKLHALEVIPLEISAHVDDMAAMENFVHHLAGRYPELTRKFDALACSLARGFEWSNGGPALAMVHGDFQPENIFVRKDGVTVIDFDGSCISDPAKDLGYLVAHVRSLSYFSTGSLETFNSSLRSFLETYLATAAHRGDSLARRIMVYAALRFFESAYYILCVLKAERGELLSAWLGEIERLTQAETIEEVVGEEVVGCLARP